MTSPAPTPVPNGIKYILPEDFEPSDYDFVIGRGKQIKQLAGNQRLYKLIHSVADDYTSGDKARKSFLLSQLVRQVYQESPEAGFVKKDPVSGRWYAVEESLARTSAAQAVRDCLHGHYKSSRQFKQKRRRHAKNLQVPVHHIPCSSIPLSDADTDAFEESSCSMSMDMMPVMSLPSLRRCVTSDASCKPAVATSMHSMPQVNMDLFSILAAKFAPQSTAVTQSSDPFEPIPIMETMKSESSQQRLASILDSVLDIDLDTDSLEEPTLPAFIQDDIFAPAFV